MTDPIDPTAARVDAIVRWARDHIGVELADWQVELVRAALADVDVRLDDVPMRSARRCTCDRQTVKALNPAGGDPVPVRSVITSVDPDCPVHKGWSHR